MKDAERQGLRRSAAVQIAAALAGKEGLRVSREGDGPAGAQLFPLAHVAVDTAWQVVAEIEKRENQEAKEDGPGVPTELAVNIVGEVNPTPASPTQVGQAQNSAVPPTTPTTEG